MSKKLRVGVVILTSITLSIGLGIIFSPQTRAISPDSCTPGETRSCTTADGYPGTQTCVQIPTIIQTEGLGTWGECIANPTPSLTINKIDTPDPVAAGVNLTYTLNFTIANASVTGFALTDEIPSNTSFVSASDPGQYNTATNKVTWNYGNLNPGNYVVVLKVLIYSPLANGTKIANTAIIDSNETDPLSATAETTVSTAPILTMTKLLDKTTANPGDTLLYTIKVTNSGTDTAKAVKLTDTLPAGFTFIDNSTASITYNFGDIEAGKTVATSYSVKIDASVSAGTYTNTATLTASNLANLTASANVAVSAPQVLGEETTKTEPVQKEEVIPEPKVLGEETLPVTGASLLGSILVSLISAAGATYIIRKKIF